MLEANKLSPYLLNVNGDLFTLHDVPGDGNCFFRAICMDQHFTQYDHFSLRQEFVTRVNSILEYGGSRAKSILDLYSIHVDNTNNDIQSYLCAIQQNREWVGLFEALVFRIVYKCDICIVSSSTTKNDNNEWFFQHSYDNNGIDDLCQGNGLFTDTTECFRVVLLYHESLKPFHPSLNKNHFLYLQQINNEDHQSSHIIINKPTDIDFDLSKSSNTTTRSRRKLPSKSTTSSRFKKVSTNREHSYSHDGPNLSITPPKKRQKVQNKKMSNDNMNTNKSSKLETKVSKNSDQKQCPTTAVNPLSKNSKSQKYKPFWTDSKALISMQICPSTETYFSNTKDVSLNVPKDQSKLKKQWFRTQIQVPKVKHPMPSLVSSYISTQWPNTSVITPTKIKRKSKKDSSPTTKQMEIKSTDNLKSTQQKVKSNASASKEVKTTKSSKSTTDQKNNSTDTNHQPTMKSSSPVPFITVDENHNIHSSSDDLAAPVKSRKFKLFYYPTDNTPMNDVFGAVRFTYNKLVDIINDKTTRQKMKDLKMTMRQYLRYKCITNTSELVVQNPWLLNVKNNLRDDAVKEVLTALKANMTKLSNGSIKEFKLNYKKKKCKSESFYCQRGWIKDNGDHLVINLNTSTKKCSLKYKMPKDFDKVSPILHDCRIQRTWLNELFLVVPVDYVPEANRVESQDPKSLPSLRVCSLDPGVRTFQTIFDPVNDGGKVYHIGSGDTQRIIRLLQHIDNICSEMAKEKKSKRRCNLRRAMRRRHRRVHNLVSEVHKQLCKFLVTNYDVIILPSFDVSQMVTKDGRKLRRKTVRLMTAWGHYRFKQRLIFKARQYGKKVAIVNEAYTSKTCSCCGEIHKSLGGNKVYKCKHCGAIMDRDVNGAKNIYLKNCEALGLTCQAYTQNIKLEQ